VLDTPSKRGWLEPIGAAGLERACASTDRPVWALGGLRPEHAAAMRQAGARGVAVRSSIFGEPDVRSAARAWRTAVDAAFEDAR
jgi:thiamine monophosphate synthase